MASISDNGMFMPVAPTGNSGGFGLDNGWWIILLFIVLGGWGNGCGYGNGNGSEIQMGFNQAAVTSGISDIQQAICNGVATVAGAVQNGFAQAEIAANARQIADMQQNFALQQQFNNCCCENRAAIADLRYTVAQENCADRQAVNDALVNLTAQMNAGFQSIKDEFCADRLARKDEIIAELRSQLNERDRVASQNFQTAQIEAGQRALASEIENYVRPQANPAYVVPNPNCCPNYSYGSCNRMVA